MEGVLQNFISGSPFGSTEGGAAWCTKALNPADPRLETNGYPGTDNCATVIMNYQSVQNILEPPLALADSTPENWDANIYVAPTVVNTGFIDCETNATHQVSHNSIVNNQLVGSTAPLRFQSLLGIAEKWRVIGCSVTVTMEAPATANQGNVMAATYKVDKSLFTLAGAATATAISAWSKVSAYHPQDVASYDNLVTMPNVFTGQARDGCYLVLPLDNLEKWHGRHDASYYVNGYITNTDITGKITLPEATDIAEAFPWTAEDGVVVPFYTIATTEAKKGVDTTTYTSGGSLMPAVANTIVGAICFTGLDPEATLIVKTHLIIEMKVSPGTILSPQQKTAPAYDPSAIDAYYKISRQMKAAYPAAYNDLGKMWSVINQIARSLSPVLGVIPGIGGLLSRGADLVSESTQYLMNRKSPTRQSSVPVVPPSSRDKMPMRLTMTRSGQVAKSPLIGEVPLGQDKWIRAWIPTGKGQRPPRKYKGKGKTKAVKKQKTAPRKRSSPLIQL
jgi:hypothetical protein